MLHVESEHKLGAVENAVRRAAHRHEASVIAVTHVGQHLHGAQGAADAFVYWLCQHDLYAALLVADIRVSAFLPFRIAAWSDGGNAVLEAVSPVEICRLLNRPDLAPLATPLEDLLRTIMEEAARPAAAATQAAAGTHRGGLGATEDQMNVRGSLPQRIDCRGTKVEELGGTGELDTPGG